MNLADSVKSVLKAKSESIFSRLKKEDLQNFFHETKSDISLFYRSGKEQFKEWRASQNFSVREVIESGVDTLTIFKVIPGRVREGFLQFRDDFIIELERQPDQKQKTIFCLKVMGALSSFAIGILYSSKMGKVDLPFLKHKNVFTKFLVAELIFKVSQVFVMRFLIEVEQKLTDPDELNNVRYFKSLFSDREKLKAEQEHLGEIPLNDPSIHIVDELKNYIMTGKRRLL